MSDNDVGIVFTKHRFFKGCTRPAMFAGIPLMPLLGVTGAYLLLTVWSFYLVSGYVSLLLTFAFVPVIYNMKRVTKKDDQRLRQLWMRLRLRLRHRNRAMWGAISYSPIRYKKR